MDRQLFLSIAAAAAATSVVPLPAFATSALKDGAQASQADLFASLPMAKPGLWVRYIMGFGVQYQKQIGFGVEETPVSNRYFIETQVGMPGGSCNPNSMKKAYLKTREFGGLIQIYGIEAYVSRSGNLLLYDAGTTPLMLLDSKHLYEEAPCTISAFEPSPIAVPAHAVKQSEGSIVVARNAASATRCAGRFESASLREFEVWRSEEFPLGVAKINARVQGMPAFALALDSYGHDFKTGIPEPLEAVKAMQT